MVSRTTTQNILPIGKVVDVNIDTISLQEFKHFSSPSINAKEEFIPVFPVGINVVISPTVGMIVCLIRDNMISYPHIITQVGRRFIRVDNDTVYHTLAYTLSRSPGDILKQWSTREMWDLVQHYRDGDEYYY